MLASAIIPCLIDPSKLRVNLSQTDAIFIACSCALIYIAIVIASIKQAVGYYHKYRKSLANEPRYAHLYTDSPTQLRQLIEQTNEQRTKQQTVIRDMEHHRYQLQTQLETLQKQISDKEQQITDAKRQLEISYPETSIELYQNVITLLEQP